MIIQPLNIAIDRMFFISHSNINHSFNHHIFLSNHPVLFILLFTYLSVYLLISSVHARKLYLASLFRCFDEADYSPAQDLPYEPTRIHTPRDPIGEIPANQIHGDGRVCYYKNTLRNGLVIAALENRYDHMVRMISIHIFLVFHILTIIQLYSYISLYRSSLRMWFDWVKIITLPSAIVISTQWNNLWICLRNTRLSIVRLHIYYSFIHTYIHTFPFEFSHLAMSNGQRQYLYAYSQGNFREMMWTLLQNRRWISDFLPKEEFFAYLEKSGNTEMKKLWDYE